MQKAHKLCCICYESSKQQTVIELLITIQVMEEIQRVAQMPDEDLSNFLNNEDEYEYEYDVATRSPDYQLLSTQNRDQTKGQSERSRSSSPKKRRRKKRNNIPQPSGKFNNCTILSIVF